MSASRPIVIVTGANGGVGFAVCHRLLIQLTRRDPPDAHHCFNSDEYGENDVPYEGLTLIMACRSTVRAEAARTKLYALLDKEIDRLRRQPDYDGYADSFRPNVAIEVHYLDLGIMHTVFQFADAIKAKYPYVSHMVFNAGLASFSGIDWLAAIKQIAMTPITAVTTPNFHLQHAGEMSVDGLGWVWQCNLFGHYALFRALDELLRRAPPNIGARVIWTTSLDAQPGFYELDDWQLIKTHHSYGGSKYQMDLIATHLDRLALKSSGPTVRHILSEPGTVTTNIQKALIGDFLDWVKEAIFYLVRWLGSPHHTVTPYKSAIAVVHLCLISLAFVPSPFNPSNSIPRPIRFSSQAIGLLGVERVGTTEVKEWEANEEEGARLLQKCDALYEAFREKEAGP
ncbi:hypothetical protein PLICRDRAFT_170589 [Plicaturopsis crispa FD-325 SS-3]|nr:hypothetical protein PLICRDRAFT_170589 [Plicaturopsis crispa FD-325 SS-3]